MAAFPAVLQSEWTKVRSVRSTVWTLAVTFLIVVAMGFALSLVIKLNYDQFTEHNTTPFDATATSLSGISLGELAIVVFGVLAVGNEYSSGMIRVSLAAVPQRGVLMGAKTAVLGALAFAVSLVTVFAAFFLGQVALGKYNTGLGEPNVLRAVFGAACYLTLLCLFSVGVTMMLRNQVLSLGILIPFFFLVSPILAIIPVVKTWVRYFPDQAGRTALEVFPTSDHPYGPWTGLLICAAWTAAALLGGYLVLKKRDA
ncbi:ABC transporter permease [Kitasatospora cheerisanensis]|uniref:ABC transporter n=1 Tax=Kitasatospora cheerisanensis KCTC 2395 TaxID=1348663 RepID=A0A066Z072_9ACTN|nr:ABC transporter permease [Kitasatospora cheerisanensis]KDN83580.1 ABC transporter [Kitasatospora cheerisanensis KCTC 2395]